MSFKVDGSGMPPGVSGPTGPQNRDDKKSIIQKIRNIMGQIDFGFVSTIKKMVEIVHTVFSAINPFASSKTTQATNAVALAILTPQQELKKFENEIDAVLEKLCGKSLSPIVDSEKLEEGSENGVTDGEDDNSVGETEEEMTPALEKAKNQLVEDLNRKFVIEYKSLDGNQILSLDRASQETGISLVNQDPGDSRDQQTEALKQQLKKQVDALPDNLALNIIPYVNQGIIQPATAYITQEFVMKMEGAIPELTTENAGWVIHVKDLGSEKYEIEVKRNISLKVIKSGAYNTDSSYQGPITSNPRNVQVEIKVILSPGEKPKETFSFTRVGSTIG